VVVTNFESFPTKVQNLSILCKELKRLLTKSGEVDVRSCVAAKVDAIELMQMG
jgi:hypothetical protein